ncbi:glutathione S-transferase N-terminal domain-containing protein [Neptunicoccus cionae]|uniref:Thiol:disulfide oxidoreductase n=1 Tax=Neptunicoccus cionae TaxID=2035344 RepID=A0A916VM36_9RHOB|nr:glutathione S-transferase N-terminal domain-containing protein [Amylibacter cionae]GGA06165.1 thiol:disulfide oxidoreductase [Amylibacter cionae]
MTAPLDFYYWPTPNGWKVSICLEEMELPYTTRMLEIGKGAQFEPEFLAISPNNRMPAIVDHDTDAAPVSVFESGAILWYLAEKTGKFISTEPVLRKETLEWLFWQTGNQGPMAGQHSHFHNYAPESEQDGYAAKRYAGEYMRCLGVLERRLNGRDYIVEDYSIADMMCWPWVLIGKAMGLPLDDYPRVTAWRARIKDRPAVQRGVNLGKDNRPNRPHTEAERNILFGQQ